MQDREMSQITRIALMMLVVKEEKAEKAHRKTVESASMRPLSFNCQM
jgi:hypothetical protein